MATFLNFTLKIDCNKKYFDKFTICTSVDVTNIPLFFLFLFKEKPAVSNEQRTKRNEQRVKSKEQLAKTNEQQATCN